MVRVPVKCIKPLCPTSRRVKENRCKGKPSTRHLRTFTIVHFELDDIPRDCRMSQELLCSLPPCDVARSMPKRPSNLHGLAIRHASLAIWHFPDMAGGGRGATMFPLALSVASVRHQPVQAARCQNPGHITAVPQ